MTKNVEISIRYKISTGYGFHMDFQFWVHLTMLGGFQMLQSPRITKLDLEQPEMVQNQFFLFQRLDFEYTQLLPGPVLKNLKFWNFWTPLMKASNFLNELLAIQHRRMHGFLAEKLWLQSRAASSG